MSQNKSKLEADRESILLALDQLTQTMDVMRQVVSRLSRCVEQAQTHMSQDQLAQQDSANDGPLPPYTKYNHPRRRKEDAVKPLVSETPIVLH